MDVVIVVATFGDSAWIDLAKRRAIPSAQGQAPVIHVHDDTLAASRNAGLARVESEWVCFLDADDALAPGYVDAMSAGTADLRAPAVSYVRDEGATFPQVPRVVGHKHACSADCLETGNWIVVGACVRTRQLRDIGGWGSEPLYEDWSAWRRLWKAGASIEALPDAVYRAYVRPESRNQASRAERVRWTRQIAAA